MSTSVFSRLFRLKRPQHAFVLTESRLVYVSRRDPSTGKPSTAENAVVKTASRPLPEGTFRRGKGNAPVADGALQNAIVALVREGGGKVHAASLVVPDHFVEVLSVDVDDPDKSPKEASEILSWKFAKVFGEPLPPLRLAWQTAGPGTDGVRVLAVATPEEAATSWEAPFAAAGVRIGSLETASLAVSALGQAAVSGNGFVVWAEGRSTTALFFENGSLRFMRTRPTADPEDALQEIRLAASFVSKNGPIDVEGACAAGPFSSPVVERFRAFRAEAGGREPVAIGGKAGDDPAVAVALGAMAKAEG